MSWLALGLAVAFLVVVMGGTVLLRRRRNIHHAWMWVFVGLTLVVLALVLGFIPTWGTATEYVIEPKRVNCGSILIMTKWTGDEGCGLGPPELLMSSMIYVGLAGLAAGLVGGGLLVRDLVANGVKVILDRRLAADHPSH